MTVDTTPGRDFSTPDGAVKAAALNLGTDNGSLGTVTTLFQADTANSFAPNSKGTEFVLAETPFSVGQTLTVLTNWDARVR